MLSTDALSSTICTVRATLNPLDSRSSWRCRRDADLSLVVVTAARVIGETTFEDASRSSRRRGACRIDNHRGIFVERRVAVSLTRP